MSDRTLPVHAPAPHPPSADPRRWWALVLLALAQFMVILDVTVVNVALPSIGADLHLDRASLTWVVTAYTLCFGGLMLLGGRLADTLGRRRTFLAGLGVFTAASAASGLAQTGRCWSPPAPARASARRCCRRRDNHGDERTPNLQVGTAARRQLDPLELAYNDEVALDPWCRAIASCRPADDGVGCGRWVTHKGGSDGTPQRGPDPPGLRRVRQRRHGHPA